MKLAFIGPDMTGKSNIAAELSRRINTPVFKNSGEWKTQLESEDYFLNLLRFGGPFLMDFMKQTDANVILDRFYPCELVYSEAFGRSTDMKAISWMDHEFAAAGGKFIIDKLKKNNQFSVLPNIDSEDFLSLMKHANVMIGNTSAAIREAPSFSLPAVNIGTRQNKRLRAKNVIDCEHKKDKIVKALKKALYNKRFLSKLKNIKNPYGDGNTAKKIVDKLLKINLKKFNIKKTISN